MPVKFIWNWFKAQKAVEDISANFKKDAAEYMAERARAYAPVDTGFLKSEIVVVAPSGSMKAHVLARADYSQWVEFGHLAGGWRGSPRIRSCGRRWLTPHERSPRSPRASRFCVLAARAAGKIRCLVRIMRKGRLCQPSPKSTSRTRMRP